MIIGCGGSGKTSLARRIGQILKIDVTHLDLLFWRPGWIATEKSRWKQIITDVSSRKQWIIDGYYGGTIDIRLMVADTVIFLDVSRLICLWRVLKRRILYHGKTRPDISEGCPESLSWGFIKWIWTFPNLRRPELLKKLDDFKNEKDIIILRSNKDIKSLLSDLRRSCKEDQRAIKLEKMRD